MAIATYTDGNFSPLFKTVWGEYASMLYGTGAEDPLMSQLKKTFNFTGSQKQFPVDLSFGGGVGFNTLPEANTSNKKTVTLTRKKAYARLKLDRETMVASRNREGAFREATKYETQAKLRSFMRVQACMFYNDGTGILGQFSGSASGSAAAPVLTILNTGTYKFRQAFFEEGDYVNVVQAGPTVLSSVFEVTAVNISTREVTLARISGSDDLTGIGAGTHSVVLQNSYNAAPTGLKGVTEKTSSTQYGVAVGRRWQSQQITLTGSPAISVDHLNRIAIQTNNLTGEYPTHFVGSAKQYEKMLNRLGDALRYTKVLSSPNKLNGNGKVAVSFQGISLSTVAGEVPFLPSRYVEDDRVYMVNVDHIEQMHAENFGWFENDGTVLLRMASDDAYEARYGGYYENYIVPQYQGYITGFATA